MEKHTFYYKIMDSFQADECPACFYLSGAMEKYFDDLLYEGVNDFGFIGKFRENKGFCNFHSYKFLGYKNAMASASLYYYLSMDKLDEMKSISPANPGLTQTKDCQACDFARSSENMYISSLKDFMIEEEFKGSFLNSHGLCVPHYLKLIKKYKNRPPEWIKSFQISIFEEIFSKLKNFIDFRNYSLGGGRPDLTYEEQLIYQKAVRMFSGYEGMKY